MILDIETSLGYPEIGALLSGVLFGILTMQVYIYHKNFPNDSVWIKFGLVDSMWFFELAHTICEFYGLYYVTVFRYGDPTVFLAIPHELAAVPFFDGFIATIVQAFFTHRIAKFSGRPYTVPIVCCILMVFQMVALIALSAGVITERSTHRFLDQWSWLIITTGFFHIAIDIILSTALVYHLIKNRSDTNYRSTYVVIDKLIQWAIETGVITSSVGIIEMICFLIDPTNFLWIAFYAVLPKFSSNAMLANLNSRMRLRDMQVTTVTELVTIPLPGTTAQSLEVQTSLPETPHVPSESIIQEGHQFEIKALPVSHSGLSGVK